MPDSGSGVYSLPPDSLGVTGQTILAQTHNSPITDIAAALNRRHFSDGRTPFRGDQNVNGYRFTNAADAEDPQDYVTLAQVQALIAAVSFIFPGFQIVDTITSAAAPAGWLYANGQEVSRGAFPELWARVSTGNNLAATQGAKTHGQYGPGNGTTTFTLPNLYGASTADGGYFIRPISSGRGIGTVQADELKAHPHTASFAGNPVPDHIHITNGPTGGGNTYGQGNVGNAANAVTQPAGGHTPSGTVTVNAAGGAETRPKNIAYPVLIKT